LREQTPVFEHRTGFGRHEQKPEDVLGLLIPGRLRRAEAPEVAPLLDVERPDDLLPREVVLVREVKPALGAPAKLPALLRARLAVELLAALVRRAERQLEQRLYFFRRFAPADEVAFDRAVKRL